MNARLSSGESREYLLPRPCSVCSGRGYIEGSLCTICNGAGRIEPRFAYEYAEPADADSAIRPELVSQVSEDQLDALAINFGINRRNALSTSTALNNLTQARSLEDKTFRCIRIAQLIFHSQKIASDKKIEIMANLLMQLPENDLKTIRILLEDFTVEQVPDERPKPLNRFQILKQT
jgi:hypothetical protein